MAGDDKIDSIKLIKTVEAHPLLWDMTHSDYTDRERRKDTWEIIVEDFVENTASPEERIIKGEFLQKRWKNLRDRYAREVVHRQTREDYKKKSKYKYTHVMKFLDDVVNLTPRKKMKTSEDEQSQPVPKLKVIDPPKEIQNYNSDFLRHNQLMEGDKRNNVNVVFQADLIDHVSRSGTKDKLEEDDDLHFLLSLLPIVKAIPKHLKLNARIEMMQCLNNYFSYGRYDNLE